VRNKALAMGICFDLLAGLVALVAIGIAAVWTPVFTDSRLGSVIETLLFVAVGFVRGQSLPANGYLKACLLVSPCTLVLATAALVLAWVSGARVLPFMLGLIAVISYPAALAGIAAKLGFFEFGREPLVPEETSAESSCETWSADIADRRGQVRG